MENKSLPQTIKTIRDGKPIIKMECPDCKEWGSLDEDQYNGRVSILCDCGFHETIDFVKGE